MARVVVVLGAGMVGTATALELQARGFDVTLIDRAAPGSETSYGNAGVIQGEALEPYPLPRDIVTLWRIFRKSDNSVQWDLPGLWRLAPSLFSYWRNSAPGRHSQISLAYAALIRRATGDHEPWIEASGSDALIRREGYRLGFRDSLSFEMQVEKAERWRRLYGAAFEVQDSRMVAASEPALRRPLAGAIHWQDAWTCSDPGGLVKAYADLFVRRGGDLVKADLAGFEPRGQGWRVIAGSGPIDGAHVVVALGPWSPQALAPLGYRINMVGKRGYHMHFRYPDANGGTQAPRLDLPLIDTDMAAVYSPMRAGLRVATGADLSAKGGGDVPRQLERATAAARELLDLGDAVETAAWSGVRPCLPDMIPLVGSAPHHPGLWFNFGHGHQGFTLGPTTGKLLAGMMAGEIDADILPLSPSRLAA